MKRRREKKRMKIKFRFGDPDYWNKTEDWQFRARRNIFVVILLSAILVIMSVMNDNYKGAITFGIVMTLFISPQYYQFYKWQKKYYRNKYGITKDE